VFQDVVAIAPGRDFTTAIDRALDDADAVLAVIGPGWLTAATPQGASRLSEAHDYVRLELARALARDLRVVPVLVGGASLPAATELTDDLEGLVRRQAVVLHDETWHEDVDGLVGSLRGEPAVPAIRRPAGCCPVWLWRPRWRSSAWRRGCGDRAPAGHQTPARDPAATGRPRRRAASAARRQRAKAGLRLPQQRPAGLLLRSARGCRAGVRKGLLIVPPGHPVPHR
jgi:hypothetical protein